jgi:uncharacterized protein (DUF433 family)
MVARNAQTRYTYSIPFASASVPSRAAPFLALAGPVAMHPHVKCTKIGGMQPFDRITWNPNQMNGQPCIRGMRLTVRRVLEAVALYPNRDDLFRNYPEFEPDDIQQALAFAAANLEDSAAESNAA